MRSFRLRLALPSTILTFYKILAIAYIHALHLLQQSMIDNFDFTGIWRGEYVYEDKFQPTIVKTGVPFILRIKATADKTIFSGICQDDPAASKIHLPADVYATIKDYEIFFVKKYAKTLISDAAGNVIMGEEPHPDIIYKAKMKDVDKIAGTWQMERTFRKVNEQIIEIPKTTGHWWIERL